MSRSKTHAAGKPAQRSQLRRAFALSFLRCYGIKITRTLAASHITTAPDGRLILDLGKTRETYRKSKNALKNRVATALKLLIRIVC